MQNNKNMEQLMEETDAPFVVEGPHREHLKRILLQAMHQKPTATRWTFWQNRWWPRVAACLLGMAIMAAAWGAEPVIQKIKSHFVDDVVQATTQKTLVTPDGHETTLHSIIVSPVEVRPGQDPQDAIKQRERQRQQISELIAQKKYRFSKQFEGRDGQTQYVYEFVLPEGTVKESFMIPLEKVTSLQDYQQKAEAVREHRDEQIAKAVAAGRFRLIDINLYMVHLCRETKTQQNILVQAIHLPDGKVIAHVRSDPYGDQSYDTPWADHLHAISEGTRELRDVAEVVKGYTYEITLEDGSKTKLTIGSTEKPLGKPKAPPPPPGRAGD